MEQEKLVENYEAPMVEVVEVEVEKGFATTGEGGVPEPFKLNW